MNSKAMNFLKEYGFIIFLVLFCFGIFVVSVRINTFRYENFDFGKFDLGNMTQMVWNTLHGRVLYLTDYFGTNLPRWSMSHVDPILLLFVPIFALFQHPLTLVFSQLVLIIFAALILYKIADLELESKPSALFIALAYLFYPALGFIIAWTGFHGVTVVIPFFLGAFYIFERMDRRNDFSKKSMITFWVLLVLAMMGKEEIPLFVLIYGFFIVLFRNRLRFGLSVALVGFLWFVIAFFVIIPKYAHYRIDGYQKFAESLDINTDIAIDVAKPNYFLSRYSDFGDSYSDVFINMALNPDDVIRVFISGDKLENLRMTFEPVAYLPLLYPPILIASAPEFMINYTTTSGGIGASEIYNHRISMIIPVLFLSSIYAISSISSFLNNLTVRRISILLLSAVLLASNIKATFAYENPVYLWITQAIQKRLPAIVFAEEIKPISDTELVPGVKVKLPSLETKDRTCAKRVVGMIPDNASVSGPDYLGAHLSMRETYAIFPALYDSADFVIVDVFARKVLTILDVDLSLINDVVGKVIKNENYKLVTSCGNLFVFEKAGPHGKYELLPLQEEFEYEERFSYEIGQSLHIVDYKLPDYILRGESTFINNVYVKRGNETLNGFVLYTVLVNKKTDVTYQSTNLPSFGLRKLNDWKSNHYYLEDIELVLSSAMEAGDYYVFVGLTNKAKTRNVFLGEVKVL